MRLHRACRRARIEPERSSSTGEDLLKVERSRDAQDPRQQDRDDLPGSDDVAQPRAHRSASRSPRRSPASRAHKNSTRAMQRRSRCSRSSASRRPERRINDYPHQFSGGMRQRVMIAMALACDPAAAHRRRADDRARRDDPGADPGAHARPAAATGAAIIMITHDLGVVAEVCNACSSCTAATWWSTGRSNRSSANPKHPYTWGCSQSLPRLDDDETQASGTDQGSAAEPAAPAARLLVRSALPYAHADLRPSRVPLIDRRRSRRALRASTTTRADVRTLTPHRALGVRRRWSPAVTGGCRYGSAIIDVCKPPSTSRSRSGVFSRHVGDVKAVDGVRFSISAARRSASSASRAAARRRRPR